MKWSANSRDRWPTVASDDLLDSVRHAPIVLLGAGGHGRVALDVCRAADMAVAGFLDGNAPSATIDGSPVLGDDTLLSNQAFIANHTFLPAVGNQVLRRRLCGVVMTAGGKLATAIHPSAVISRVTQIGVGTLVVAGTVINTGVRIGISCIINTRAAIDHDCTLGDGVQIGPGAILCGGVKCGIDVEIGAGAVILPGRIIGAGAIIGAGSIVTRDVADRGVVKGNPARAN
jgi:sugar O-acyltransferase (sialic acid O-acetyltransferase NeuD family)